MAEFVVRVAPTCCGRQMTLAGETSEQDVVDTRGVVHAQVARFRLLVDLANLSTVED